MLYCVKYKKFIMSDRISTGGLAPKERSRAASFLSTKFTIILTSLHTGFVAGQLQM